MKEEREKNEQKETIVIHIKKWNRTISKETESDCEPQQKSSKIAHHTQIGM